MTHAEYLKQLLAPLGVYDFEGPFHRGELDALGQALDGLLLNLEEVQREGDLTAAESWGLERTAALFTRRPVAATGAGMREALAALLRIGGDSFTLEAINSTISGCGIRARVEEDGVGSVRVLFPGTPGIPEGFADIQRIIEDILPSHLLIQYAYWFLTWAELERKLPSWQAMEAQKLTWKQLEILVG